MKAYQFDWVRAVLDATARRWLDLTKAAPDELLVQQPAPGEWSALECLQHLVDTERQVFPVRIRQFFSGQDLANFDPERAGTAVAPGVSGAGLAAAFAELREASLPLLDSLEVADLDRLANHSALGQVTLGEMLNEWAAHDLMHTVQAERALMQPFIRLSGPWKPFFADHAVEGTRKDKEG